MNFSRLRQHTVPWAMAVVLALLLLTGWGQVHRVLHPGTATHLLVATADASHVTTTVAVPLAGHKEGGDLCRLLDHLSQGAVPVPVLAALAAIPLPPLQPAWTPLSHHAVELAPFEARGPPHLT